MMTKDEIAKIINPQYPNVYGVTYYPTKLTYADGSIKVGYFQPTNDSVELEKEGKFTFLEYGNNVQMYRATNDNKYVTIVDSKLLKAVEYPSFPDTLESTLNRYKAFEDKQNHPDWEAYKTVWKEAITDLHHTIIYKWLERYSEKGLMEFALLPTKRNDPYIGEYFTAILEITFLNGMSAVLEPISAVTAVYDGKLEFYLRGNVDKAVTIFRKIVDIKNIWVIAYSNDPKEQFLLDQNQVEKQIAQWLQ